MVLNLHWLQIYDYKHFIDLMNERLVILSKSLAVSPREMESKDPEALNSATAVRIFLPSLFLWPPWHGCPIHAQLHRA